MSIHYIRPEGNTFEEMRDAVRKSPLYPMGDAILLWVNEGDFWMSEPIDVGAVEKERQREDAVLAEADAIRARRATAG